ncbi:MAG: hypothetical protein KJP05_06745 [Deltaproteobacteria bacterium]|nr:hypothetical protein [Deltaproteobacteria bacterium]
MEYLQAKLIMAKRISFFLLLTVIAVGTIVALAMWKWDVLVERISEEKVTAERHAWMERTRELEGIIIEMQKGTEPKPLRPAERLRQVFGPSSPLAKGASPRTMKCVELEQSLRAFCKYLDAGETFRSQKTYGDSWALFMDILDTLERKPPTISAETYRPSIILENSYFFFRLLRREKMNIVREVLQYEADLAEPLMSILYHWLINGRACDKVPSSASNLDIMYRYAGFFLNTLGGHSYLYRRDSRISLLTIYYSILVVHEANSRGFNEVGLDLRFFLPLIFGEIQSRNDLLYAEDYLQILTDLQLQYFRIE